MSVQFKKFCLFTMLIFFFDLMENINLELVWLKFWSHNAAYDKFGFILNLRNHPLTCLNIIP